MKQSTSLKRNFKIGQIVRLPNSSQPMSILKYDDRLSLETGKTMVSVTWKENNNFKIIKCDESELLPYIKSGY